MTGGYRAGMIGIPVLWIVAGCSQSTPEVSTPSSDSQPAVTPAPEVSAPPDVARHLAVVEAETRPRGISRRFPALVMACDGASSLLLSASWGAEPFPTGEKNGTPIGAIFLRDGGQPVEIIGYDERSGVSVLAVEKALLPLPRELFAGPVETGNQLNGLNVSEQSEPERVPLDVVGVGRTFRRRTTADEWIGVEGTIQFTGGRFGNPGAVLLKDGKVAAIFLNNEGDVSRRFALPIRQAVEAYERITAIDRD